MVGCRYHIPKSYLNSNGLNTLVIFEELGGNPATVSFDHAAITIICGSVDEGNKMELWCGTGHYIHEVRFAGFGDPQGSCLEFDHGTCEGPDAMTKVKEVTNAVEFVISKGLKSFRYLKNYILTNRYFRKKKNCYF